MQRSPLRFVVVDAPLPPQHRRQLEVRYPNLQLLDGLSAVNLRHAEVVFLGKGQLDPVDAPNLRWVQFSSHGVGELIGTALATSSVPVLSACGAYSTTVAEMVLALLLSLMRNLPACLKYQQRHTWPEINELRSLCGQSCRGRTAGIVGYGSIGREVGRLFKALGMRVLACKRRPEMRLDNRFCLPGTGDPAGTIPEAWYGFKDVEFMLSQSDVLVVTLPATNTTNVLLTRHHLSALPPHALLVSVGRGTVIDEQALTDLLRDGRIAGAGIDVFAEEPLRPTSPLWSMPNVVIAPHIASYTVEQEAMASEVLVENMRRDHAGEPLLNLINFVSGY